jgi:hypothetical protein
MKLLIIEISSAHSTSYFVGLNVFLTTTFSNSVYDLFFTWEKKEALSLICVICYGLIETPYLQHSTNKTTIFFLRYLNSRTPIIRKLIIRIANYPDIQGP